MLYTCILLIATIPSIIPALEKLRKRQLSKKKIHEEMTRAWPNTSSILLTAVNLIHRERGGSRIPHPLGWG